MSDGNRRDDAAFHHLVRQFAELRQILFGNASGRQHERVVRVRLLDRLVTPGHPSSPGYNDPAYPLEGRVPR